MNESNVLSVTDLTKLIKNRLETSFDKVVVEGEISNFVCHSSGHMYFTLKDKDAQVSAVMFKFLNRNLKFDVESGMKVVAYGSISVYEKRGSYQLYVKKMEPAGLGALQLAFEQLKKRLEEEGLFKPEHKKPLPVFPKVIGVVTSSTGAAFRDILRVIDSRFPNTHVILAPAKVQGDGASDEICEGIRMLNQHGQADLIIAGRGGGSLEDLWAFNEEKVAREIFASEIPVISAVGHEIDYTIADFVADVRAATPSVAAEIALKPRVEWEEDLQYLIDRLTDLSFDTIESLRDRINKANEKLTFFHPSNRLAQYRQRVDELTRQMNNYFDYEFKNKRGIFADSVRRLELLSPLKVLGRGYSMTLDEKGHVLTDAEKVKTGDKIRTKLANGEVSSVVC